MADQIISNYLSGMEDRLEAPYRARAIVLNFFLSLALIFAIGFLVLL